MCVRVKDVLRKDVESNDGTAALTSVCTFSVDPLRIRYAADFLGPRPVGVCTEDERSTTTNTLTRPTPLRFTHMHSPHPI
jgi:hypothetical protein